MQTTITIHLDELTLQRPAPLSLAELLQEQGRPADSVATALNGQFIARAARPATLLQDGDAVLLFKAIVGG
ncbi:sulfur carrier protein ThiS [Roseateles koreensis]|uniref:Sulfur carrier protein ThiS n=1 Tax=Roseateles koreensis TaxID=2987526 RepID=A0ABT5KQX8_9BURK|nr:sulfur carrier protein ThiS [Roseateles koreensis]MDC8785325.1 sulfur carrier protein ThiS [Roseateles koreensis]